MKQNGRAWITLLISVLVALAVLTLSACGFGTPDDDKDPSGTGGLTEEEMAQIAAMNQQKRYYTSTPEMLDRYVQMVPPVDEQK